jgi:hypothetical protein
MEQTMRHMTPKSSPVAVFETIRSMKDGAIKRFELFKTFGLAIRQSGFSDPRTMSCHEMEIYISKIIHHVR